MPGEHINEAGQFQSDKYPTCPPGKVPLSTKDPTAQDLLWAYAQRRRAVDAEFSADLETCLKADGYIPPPILKAKDVFRFLSEWCVTRVEALEEQEAEAARTYRGDGSRE